MTTTIRTYTDDNGLPVARLTAERDTWIEDKPGEYCHTDATVRVVDAGYRVRDSYYEDTQTGPHDGPLSRAWFRFEDVAWDFREHVEMFTRWARIYYPLVAVVNKTIQTGYSQGDQVELVGWIEPNVGKTYNLTGGRETGYQRATREHAEIEGHFEVMQAVARGQYWDVTLDLAVPSFKASETDPDVGTYTLDWYGEDNITTLAMEEFDPWEELREVGEGHFNIPAHATSHDVEIDN